MTKAMNKQCTQCGLAHFFVLARIMLQHTERGRRNATAHNGDEHICSRLSCALVFASIGNVWRRIIVRTRPKILENWQKSYQRVLFQLKVIGDYRPHPLFPVLRVIYCLTMGSHLFSSGIKFQPISHYKESSRIPFSVFSH